MVTCKECRYYNKCMERSRDYPCKDFKRISIELDTWRRRDGDKGFLARQRTSKSINTK